MRCLKVYHLQRHRVVWYRFDYRESLVESTGGGLIVTILDQRESTKPLCDNFDTVALE